MKNPDIYLQQAGLKSLGFDPGPLDGDPGPRTAAARAAWEASFMSEHPDSIASGMVRLARADLGIRETEGKNQGPGIAKFWPATNYPEGYENREPYCAAAVCYWVKAAAGTLKPPFELPRTATAFGFLAWAEKQAGREVEIVAKGATFQPGDIVVFEFSHVGIVEARCPAGKTTVQTIEANTSPTGAGNEGGGVFRRPRPRNLIRGIIRITT